MILRFWHISILQGKRIIPALVAGLFLIQPVIAQDAYLINLQQVHSRTVRKYIEKRNIDKLTDFSSIQPSWNNNINKAGFSTDERTFLFRDKISRVWENYRFSDPMKSWRGRFAKVSLLIAKGSNSVFYPGISSRLMLDTGQVYFLSLRLLKGLFKLPVAFEIINIDPSARMIEYSYLEDNVAKGKQTIQLFDEGDGLTKVVHTTYYRSESHFRDNVLYPYFHKKIIRDFHKKMKRLDNKEKREAISLTSNMLTQ